MMKLLRDDNSDPEYVEMRKMLFNPYKLYSCGGVDSVIRGAMNTSSAKSDAFFTPEVSPHNVRFSNNLRRKARKGKFLIFGQNKQMYFTVEADLIFLYDII